MKIFSSKTVYDAALDRIRFLFDEFPNIVVGISGGKDSTIVLNLALQVARERGRLPLKVLWIDQEAEWQATVDHVTTVMESPDVKPYWFQMPMVITNNASSYERYSYCWDEKNRENWIHPKHPLSIQENRYGTDRFHELFEAIFQKEFAGVKSCYLSGVRTEESPKRLMSLTSAATYQWITWGKVLSKRNEHYTFYPIYDWSYTDVWKYIHDNDIPYNRVYDAMYRHGVKVMDMRVSNLHHETAIQNLLLVQEIEPETWEKISRRIDGANSIKHLKNSSFTCPKELPYMFASWEEYALYLADTIIQDETNRTQLKEKANAGKELYNDALINDAFWKVVINTILSSDWDFTKLTNFEISQDVYAYRKFKRGRFDRNMLKPNKFFTDQQREIILKQIQNEVQGNP